MMWTDVGVEVEVRIFCLWLKLGSCFGADVRIVFEAEV